MPSTTALIVGGTSGVGLATARRLRDIGSTVHIAGRHQQRLDTVAASDPDLRAGILEPADSSWWGVLRRTRLAGASLIRWLVTAALHGLVTAAPHGH